MAETKITPNEVKNLWWEEIGRTTLSSASDVITVTSFPNRKYLRFIISTIPVGGTTVHFVTFNGDTGANYASRLADNAGVDSLSTSITSFAPIPSTEATRGFAVMDFDNIATQEKLGIVLSTRNTTGAATAPGVRREGSVKWVNTSSQITSITLTNIGTGDFAAGSEIVVLGHD